jgi:hypothetical protein
VVCVERRWNRTEFSRIRLQRNISLCPERSFQIVDISAGATCCHAASMNNDPGK